MRRGDVHVRLESVAKRFGGVQALSDVSVDVVRGTTHALVGENGAGKSTLGKIVAGRVSPDGGQVLVDGERVSYRSPRQALADGTVAIAQELAILPHRSVIDNVFLGNEPRGHGGVVDGKAMRRRFVELVERTGIDVPPEVSAGGLRVADQQRVEILRALAGDARLIVMDEPTAALDRDSTQRLLDVVRGLVAGGRTVIFVSHFLDEVLDVADHITVLRDGRVVQSTEAATQTPGSLVKAMLGRTLATTFPHRRFPPPTAEPVLEVDTLTRRGSFEDICLTVRAGEIVSLAGLVGSGRSEVARAIFGADRIDAGEVHVGDTVLRGRWNVKRAVAAGMAMVPEDRKGQGLQPNRSVLENVTLAHLDDVSVAGVRRRRAERQRADEMTRRVGVRMDRLDSPVRSLSGGNQQKLMFSRWLFRQPRVVIADEPTRGVDVGAKLAIYELLTGLARRGMAVLLISSEIEEVLGLSHRVLVMRSGRIVAEVDGREATEERVMQAAFATERERG